MARRAKPWFRSAENVWYVTHNGRKIRLGVHGKANEAAAWRAWDHLRTGDGQPADTPAALPQLVTVLPPPVTAVLPLPAPAVTVAEVIRCFLDDASRARAATGGCGGEVKARFGFGNVAA